MGSCGIPIGYPLPGRSETRRSVWAKRVARDGEPAAERHWILMSYPLESQEPT